MGGGATGERPPEEDHHNAANEGVSSIVAHERFPYSRKNGGVRGASKASQPAMVPSHRSSKINATSNAFPRHSPESTGLSLALYAGPEENSRGDCHQHFEFLEILKVRRRATIGCFLMVLAVTAGCGANPELPPSGELTTEGEELVVKPHSTFWKVLNPITKGELTHTVDAGDVPIGINASPIGEGGLNAQLNDMMMATQTRILAGGQGAVKEPVE
jgi:hypothetical protein